MQRRRRRQRLPCPLRVREYLRQFVAFLFSNVGVIVLVVAYIIAGAFIFQAIEGSSEIERMQSMTRERRLVADRLWGNATLQLNVFDEQSWKRNVSAELVRYQSTVVKAVRKGWSGDDIHLYRQWNFPGSFLYSLTIITTIGYGNIAPRTDWGKVTTICYAMIGMPLFLLYLTTLGDLLARSFKWFYVNLCLCRGCPGVAKRRAMRMRMQIQAQLGESITLQETSERRRSAPVPRPHRFGEPPLRFSRVGGPEYGVFKRYSQDSKTKTFELVRNRSRLNDRYNFYDDSRYYYDDWRNLRRHGYGVRRNHALYDGKDGDIYEISKNSQSRIRTNYTDTDRYCPSRPSNTEYYHDRRIKKERNKDLWYNSKNLTMQNTALDDNYSSEEKNDHVDNYEEFLDTCSVDSDFTYITIDSQTVAVPITVCVFIMVGYIFFGAMMFTMWEEWDRVDGSYFCFISLTSIGFGDIVPGERIYARANPANKRIDTSFILCSIYLLFGMALVAMCFNLMQEQVMQYLAASKRVLRSILRCKCCKCR